MKFLARLLLSVLTVATCFFITNLAVKAATVGINQSLSVISVDKTDVRADGIDQARISVTVKNDNLLGVEGAHVVLQSSRDGNDEFTPATADTNSTGKAVFYVKSLRNGTSTITAIVNGVPFTKTVSVGFSRGLSFPLAVGSLIKIPDDGDASTQPDTAVYYYASNGKRYVFTNEKVYFSWYPEFANITVLPIDQMSLIPIGGNITYRPGSKLVKFQTDTKTYLPTKGGVLRWVQTEEVARAYFGADWNTKVDDISEAFYINYTFGTPVANALDLSLEIVRTSTNSINAHLGLGAP